jgi:hypothetical protein
LGCASSATGLVERDGEHVRPGRHRAELVLAVGPPLACTTNGPKRPTLAFTAFPVSGWAPSVRGSASRPSACSSVSVSGVIPLASDARFGFSPSPASPSCT